MGGKRHYDFGGWATRNDIECSDGRTIRKDAFIDNDGKTVPLVWGHQHQSPDKVLGHCELKNCPEGVYTYGYFNDTPQGKNANFIFSPREKLIFLSHCICQGRVSCFLPFLLSASAR